ncbi:SNAP25 homologous protein SNAP33-like isoform X2 [Carex littledalei]|uniref:SNAP25 homologous protein SNAP33-like isoform X2 n=1 Tax=Carex littledalei TaxID=544730 RepID=A0A833VJT6_9POAL|nr:SNAP25 homologous protein SNAP33-like isoform X2 [Carex littledalei]
MPISRPGKQHSVSSAFSNKANPFDSDSDSEAPNTRPSRASSVPTKSKVGSGSGPDFENQSIQELESYAANKAEETTHKVDDCLRIAEMIREDATNTLVTLHQQGEQIHRTHQVAANIDQDLSRSEKLLNSLGGLFSKPWKPKKTREIKGPEITLDDPLSKKINHMEQRGKLGLTSGQQSNPRKYAEATTAMEKVQVEKAKQDDKIDDLSNMLGQLKNIAIDMGTEVDKQNKALDAMHDDVEELNYRVKGANQRGKKLLGK